MTKSSGWIEPLNGAERMGKTPSEVLAYLKNPENEETLLALLEDVEPYWNN